MRTKTGADWVDQGPRPATLLTEGLGLNGLVAEVAMGEAHSKKQPLEDESLYGFGLRVRTGHPEIQLTPVAGQE